MYGFIFLGTVLVIAIERMCKYLSYNMEIDSHWVYKFIFNGTVLILPLGVCVCTLITTVLR